MGRDVRDVRISVFLVRDGGEREDQDDRLFEEMLEEIRAVVRKEKYDQIHPTRDL